MCQCSSPAAPAGHSAGLPFAQPGHRLSVYTCGAEEALRYKWIESEKAGADIGFEKALCDWIVKYRSSWRNKRMKEARAETTAA